MRWLILIVLLALVASRVDWRREPGAPDEPARPSPPYPITPGPHPPRPHMQACPLCGHGMEWTGYGFYCTPCQLYIIEGTR